MDELLTNVFASEITGVDAVFETDAMSVSYTIINGVAWYAGEGKLYDRKYESLKQSIQLADASLYTTGDDGEPPLFRFSLIPNDDFYDVYQTRGPIVATVVVLGSILLTISVFFLYDFFVRREFNAKRELLEARRQFMRFVSHEVRTPLNAVSMGLDLMQTEIAQDLGFDSPTCLKASIEFGESHEKTICKKQPLGGSPLCDEESPVLSSSLSSSTSTQGGLFSLLETKGSESPRKSAPTDQISTQKGSDSATPSSSTTSHTGLFSVSETDGLGCPSNAASNDTIPIKKAQAWFQLSQEIQSNAQGAVDILNALLNYDKIEQGTLQLGLEVISMWQLLEKAVMEFKLPASHKQVNLSVSFGAEGTDVDPTCRYLRPRDLPSAIRHLNVIGDSVRLTQVLRNLMSNALKFTPAEGSVHVEALYVAQHPPASERETSASGKDRRGQAAISDRSMEQAIELQKGEIVSGVPHGYVRIKVADTGAGMSSDQVARLFQDGVQFNVNELQAGGGSGLGLYIAKGIVKQHDGALTAYSEGLGHGTTFEMVLPLWDVAGSSSSFSPDTSAIGRVRNESYSSLTELDMTNMGSEDFSHHFDDSTTALSSSKTTLQRTEASPKKILVVDDVKSNRKLLMRLLQNNGHKCDEAENGQQAIDMVKEARSSEAPYDSVLLDCK